MEIQQINSTSGEIIWEKDVIKISFDAGNEANKQLFELIKVLNDKVERLEKEGHQIQTLRVSYEEAKKKIIQFLKDLKCEGHEKVDVLEISSKLKLPATQVEDVLDELEKKDLVKEEMN